MTLEKLAFLEFQLNYLAEPLQKLANVMGLAQSAAPAVGNALQKVVKPGMASRFMNASPHLNEVAGLGLIAAGPASHVIGKPIDDGTSHALDLAGLTMLAGPSAYHGFKALRGKAVPAMVH